MIITIFTALYNRSNFLDRIFNSLLSQNDIDIEWLIVDDGSTDNPEPIVKLLQQRAPFEVYYFYKKNGGKHTAINKGIDKANGKYFLMLDSDDYLPNFALKTLRKHIKEIDLHSKIAGVAGLKMYENTNLVGNLLNSNLISNALDIRYKHNLRGDLTEVFKTNVLRQYKFPEIKGEFFCPEALVWNRIAQDYNMFFFNKPIYICDYLPGGLTDRIVKLRMCSPIATMLTYSELASYRIPLIQKIKAYINFWRFSFNSKIKITEKKVMIKVWWGFLVLPLGLIYFLYDKINQK